MKQKKSPIVKSVIWICIALMVLSTFGVYVVYMFSPISETSIEESQTIENIANETLPNNIDAENPDSSDLPIINSNEEDSPIEETIEKELENWDIEIISNQLD